MKNFLLFRCVLISLLLGVAAVSAEPNESVPASNYMYNTAGGKFFLLADSSFGSEEEARVRLEAKELSSLESYGGVDVRVYRIRNPLEFLKQQKNLHRIQPDVNYRGEGLANTLSYLWDNWYRKSRRAMQRVFSYPMRKTVTTEAPSLKMGNAISKPTEFEHHPEFDPIPGLPLVSQFRYPVGEAKSIQPPAGVELSGSSSNFIPPTEGNVYIPLGKLEPGLYLAEAFAGQFRATTMVFVSDTIAVTKISSKELLVWTADKSTGKAVADTQIYWTDGVGVLNGGKTDGSGLLRLSHASSERSYVLGEDHNGGVFVSENFYYDSEIYNSKMYAFTDRPLYRPGDAVEIKIVGRHFNNARESEPPKAGPIELTIVDAAGAPLQTLKLDFDSLHGADTRFLLPQNAVAGGYEIRFKYDNQQYSSAFRVAEYVKPHFEISLNLDKTDYRAGEPVEGQLLLLYPDGKPVRGAHIDISLRAQQLSMVDSELQYLGQFPVKLETMKLVTDEQGAAHMTLPAAEKPSRYLLTIFASDGAAFRVKNTREILIERGAMQYRLSAPQRFSALGTPVTFSYSGQSDAANKPVRYEWVRLEDQSRGSAELTDSSGQFTVQFDKPGTYNLNLKNQSGLIVAGTSHTVSGPDMKAAAGSIEMLMDKSEYQAGDTALALLTFPEPVQDALLTLERDNVHSTALLSNGGDWLKIERLNDTQYQLSIPVQAEFSPNITVSALYTAHGDYSFQNAGIKVAMPTIAVEIKTEKEVYKPGDTVTVELQTRFADQPVSAQLSVSVVDEMIYVLQPEIAPAIDSFFYHPRRNNVRTSASLSFISYDVAIPHSSATPQRNRNDRNVKLLERPRREDVDTAAWKPDLTTGKDGKAQFTFVVPDSLTRWRITARAINAEGHVGQRTAYVRSDKDLYLKWSGPTRFRAGDHPALGLLAFNQQKQTITADWSVDLEGQSQRKSVELHPGINYLALPDEIAFTPGELETSLEAAGEQQDSLSVTLNNSAANWQDLHTIALDVTQRSTALALPDDATDIDLHIGGSVSSLFYSAVDDLLGYPYGCVEQTASRLLPLSLAYPQLQEAASDIRERLQATIKNSRLRLVQMAGPNAMFTWWGNISGADAFLTGYAYYADWYASRALGLNMPQDHWQRVQEVYATEAQHTPLLQRALIIDFAERMQLPVATLLQGLMDDLAKAGDSAIDVAEGMSVVMAAPDSPIGLAAARVITSRLAEAKGVAQPEAFTAGLPEAQALLDSSNLVFADAVKLYRQPLDTVRSRALLARLSPEQATLERALALTWLYEEAVKAESGANYELDGEWEPLRNSVGGIHWQWRGETPPKALELAEQPKQPLHARVNFSSAGAPVAGNAQVQVTRHMQQLVPGNESLQFQGQDISDNKVSSDALYLDEIIVKSSADKPLRYGIVEVPLPPGADVERTTWGIQITPSGGPKAAPLEKAQNETGQLLYAVPIDSLTGELHIRHLVRFSQKGSFNLPAVRYRHMYDPAKSALESPVVYSTLRVE
jgi:uncharacterized protein YfaS (alpha-2-macroglobulin family)